MISYMISYTCGGGVIMNKEAYINQYNKDNYKMYQFRVRKSDVDLINKLDSVHNRNSYITNLIINDLKPNVLSIKQIKDRIKPIIKKHQIKDVYLFGSYSRGEANENSDVDIYCDKGDLRTLYDEVDLIDEFENALGKKVDLVTIGSRMQDFFKQQIEEDMIKIC